MRTSDTIPLHPAPSDPVEAFPERAAGRTAALAVEVLLLPARQAAVLCGVSTATWWRWDASGRNPAPLRLSAGCVRWRRAELMEWAAAGCPDRRTWQALQGNNSRWK
jgi:prophage regulatory protein